MLTHYNIISNTSQVSVEGFLAPKSDDVFLALLPWFHIYGMVTILFIGLRYGVKVASMGRFDPKVFLETIQKYKVLDNFLSFFLLVRSKTLIYDKATSMIVS